MLAKISLLHFRNILDAELSPSSGINLILGENGSGKTSLLEAIYLLAMGRSFRSRQLKVLVNNQHERLMVVGRTAEQTPIGLQYDLSAGMQIRLDNSPLKKLSDLAQHLPIQFIPANCHQYFELGPKFRRKMVDWGVFHVEHHFNFHWQSYKKALQQRNAAIRQRKPGSEISVWNKYLVEHGENISAMRKGYLEILMGYFRPLFQQLCPDLSDATFHLRYLQGWNKDKTLEAYLRECLERDVALGYTRSGAHAADWLLRVNDSDPYEMLSRGQQKLFFLALSMAQIVMLAEKKQLTNTILMIDDLTSELDWQHQKSVMETLRLLPVQSFITSTNEALTDLIGKTDEKLFHVKQGSVTPI